jgi:hypothetical protein
MTFVCPGCGRPVEVGEDYVEAHEYEVEADFRLHTTGDVGIVVTRRFHVEHFRGRIDGRFYELVWHEH